MAVMTRAAAALQKAQDARAKMAVKDDVNLNQDVVTGDSCFCLNLRSRRVAKKQAVTLTKEKKKPAPVTSENNQSTGLACASQQEGPLVAQKDQGSPLVADEEKMNAIVEKIQQELFNFSDKQRDLSVLEEKEQDPSLDEREKIESEVDKDGSGGTAFSGNEATIKHDGSLPASASEQKPPVKLRGILKKITRFRKRLKFRTRATVREWNKFRAPWDGRKVHFAEEDQFCYIPARE